MTPTSASASSAAAPTQNRPRAVPEAASEAGNTSEPGANGRSPHQPAPESEGTGVAVPVAIRLANLLALSLPLGGLAFFGIFAAPAMFRVARAAGQANLAPQMVAVMLGRFGWVLIACTLLASLCWLFDRPRSALQNASRTQLWWRLQGAASVVSLGVATYLQLGLMPRILAMQGQVLAQADPALRASFDVAHKSYSSAAAILLWASLFALGCLARRSVR